MGVMVTPGDTDRGAGTGLSRTSRFDWFTFPCEDLGGTEGFSGVPCSTVSNRLMILWSSGKPGIKIRIIFFIEEIQIRF